VNELNPNAPDDERTEQIEPAARIEPADQIEPADRIEPAGTARPEERDGPDTVDFFGATAPPTLPVPSTPPPVSEPPVSQPPVGAPSEETRVPAPTAATGPPAATVDRPVRVRRGIRVRTMVFGVVMLVISGASLVALLTKVHVDGGIVGLALLVGAGAALLLGGLSAAINDVRHGGTRYS